jgi:hypothetical protein
MTIKFNIYLTQVLWLCLLLVTSGTFHMMAYSTNPELGITTVPASMGSQYTNNFNRYTSISAPNGGKIHIVAQSLISNEQIVRARNVLQHFLNNYSNSQYGANKNQVTNKMANNGSILLLLNGSDNGSNDPSMDGQALYQDELVVEGSTAYIQNDYDNHRDATFEEILHLVHDFGIGVDGVNSYLGALPNYQSEIRSAQQYALSNNLWGIGESEWIEELTQENSLTQEYLAAVIDSYYGLWGAYSGNKGMWGLYIAKSRSDIQNKDSRGWVLVGKYFHPYLTYNARIASSFQGTFSLLYDSSLAYTHKSQYLKDVTLTGSNNSNVKGNGYNNSITGNSGSNTVVFRGTYAQYSVVTGGGVTTVTDSVSNRDGVDTLTAVEYLQFSDQTVKVSDTGGGGGSGPGNVPFGDFATPLNNSNGAGSIPVTGWALDDQGVQTVKIYRQSGNSLVFIGDAVFVEGARPDVAAQYPGYPFNTRSGWGYMMLSNFLPNGGNGTFTLHAIATDMEGQQTTLGTKTVYLDNANAVKPFGAIDTPTQGGTASGTGYINWGWALTPQPAQIPTDGSTITVYVNGVSKGHPVYNLYRTDIATLFPNYANSSGAVGFLRLDTTGLPDGVHTIQWVVTDNQNHTDGIGSRYFSIQNSRNSNSNRVGDRTWTHISQLEKIRLNTNSAFSVTRGFNENCHTKAGFTKSNGIAIIIRELEHVKIQLAKIGKVKQGFMISGQRLQPLPVGSTLDTKNNTFLWSPGPGFVKEYKLVFILENLRAQLLRQHVTVTILPRASGGQGLF